MNAQRAGCGFRRVVFRLALIVLASVYPTAGMAAEYRLFWGDVNTHGNLSDGKGTPDQFLIYARNAAHLDFQINGHPMGGGIVTQDKPLIAVSVSGTAPIAEVAIIRDGSVLERRMPDKPRVKFTHRDSSFQQSGYYYFRVVQNGADENDKPSRAGSSPIWVKQKRATARRGKGVSTEVSTESPEAYITSIPPESPEDREARRKKISLRRAGPVVIVHRGAWAFAPENTLSAYAAAMDYGADGCEIDIRRTADGVLVMFHDEGLDRMTDALGPINQYTYAELSAVKFRSVYGVKPGRGIPTLAAVLELARQRAMLLHLDVKEPGLEEDIAKLLDAAEVWDHVVWINESNATALRKNPKAHFLAYKAFGWQERRMDMDPEKVRKGLAKPGNMIMVDDPRVAARQLKRRKLCVPLPDHLRAPLPPALAAAASQGDRYSFSPAAYLRSLASQVDGRSLDALGTLLAAEFPERTNLEADAALQQRRARRILERAWAAEQIGQLPGRSPRAVQLLEELVARRTLHPDGAYSGLDGAMAARALGALGATASVPFLVRTFFAVDPQLKKMVKPSADYAYAWADYRLKREIIDALGELPCEAGRRFFCGYLALDEAAATKSAPPLFEEATRALLRQEVPAEEVQTLLRSTNSAVRGTAILCCLDGRNAVRASLLWKTIAWTQELPQAGK